MYNICLRIHKKKKKLINKTLCVRIITFSRLLFKQKYERRIRREAKILFTINC